jgi:hypothetical protein
VTGGRNGVPPPTTIAGLHRRGGYAGDGEVFALTVNSISLLFIPQSTRTILVLRYSRP